MDVPAKSAPPPEPVERSMLVDTLTYPVRSGGLLMIAIGAGFSILMSIGALGGILGVVAFAFGGGFFASYYLDIINTTVNGSDDVPDWPSISDFMDDIVSPLLKTMGVSLICGLPLLLTLLLDKASPLKEPCEVVSVAFMVFYFPMATLGLVLHGHLGGCLPHRVLPAIFRSLPAYLLVVVMFAVLLFLSSLSETIGSKVPFVGAVLTAAPTLYLLMAQGRLIGLLYRSKREQIGWG